jgi:hypothetical protein
MSRASSADSATPVRNNGPDVLAHDGGGIGHAPAEGRYLLLRCLGRQQTVSGNARDDVGAVLHAVDDGAGVQVAGDLAVPLGHRARDTELRLDLAGHLALFEGIAQADDQGGTDARADSGGGDTAQR